MNARRNPDGDAAPWRQLLQEAKCVVKRRIAKPGVPVDEPERPYLVVPILGQSNAFGMGLGLDPTGLDRPHPLVHQWAMCGPSKGTAVLGADPLLHEIPCKRVGFGVTFGKRLADATGRAVLLVPGARGDTSFTPKNGYTWDGNDTSTRVNLYRQAVRAIDAAIERHPGSEVAVVLWHQGETDVPLMSAEIYREKLDTMVGDLRRRYGGDTPFVLGQMVPEEMERSGKDYSKIDAVHQDTPNRLPNAAFVPGPRESFNSDLDRHYDAAGLRELGDRMWRAYAQLCPAALTRYRTVEVEG
ncbi:sialate O-acetylesterase [Mycolicibacterium sp. 050158]|jgi:Carbohydrate esterase, sialic acid-specific acetylesterase|uniref:sialate O-acetylesterase n=1 Tax=Mycolicibacterium sp. 050158 TaxID=3090602 RepID=UPI00299CE498|nr:sialate O-acetylesterase [Mycolicibacterium sp. 050158]MDX1888562.1 sialate O-acetylesterase [Mycolicibacterium sp. 050158]